MDAFLLWEIVGLVVTGTYFTVVRLGDPLWAPEMFRKPVMGALVTAVFALAWPVWALGLLAHFAAGKGSAR